MGLRQHGPLATVESLDDPDLPQGPGPVERLRHDPAHQLPQIPFAPGSGKGGMAEVIVDVEMGIVDPHRRPRSKGTKRTIWPVARHERQLAADPGHHVPKRWGRTLDTATEAMCMWLTESSTWRNKASSDSTGQRSQRPPPSSGRRHPHAPETNTQGSGSGKAPGRCRGPVGRSKKPQGTREKPVRSTGHDRPLLGAHDVGDTRRCATARGRCPPVTGRRRSSGEPVTTGCWFG